jgi:hypothetical protein
VRSILTMQAMDDVAVRLVRDSESAVGELDPVRRSHLIAADSRFCGPDCLSYYFYQPTSDATPTNTTDNQLVVRTLSFCTSSILACPVPLLSADVECAACKYKMQSARSCETWGNIVSGS